MSNLVEFAKTELDRILQKCEDEESIKMQTVMNNDILNIIELFSNQGHSGFSASYALNILTRLLKFNPIAPLTGEDDEWVKLDYNDDTMYQNKRCSGVFKNSNNQAYYIDGKVFSNDNGHTWYTNKDSRIFIEFPFNVPDDPERIIIDNKELRDKIQAEIVNIISSELNTSINNDNINEETKISTLIDKDNYIKLEELIKEKYNIEKLIHNISDDDKMWNIVNLVINELED